MCDQFRMYNNIKDFQHFRNHVAQLEWQYIHNNNNIIIIIIIGGDWLGVT